MKNRHAPLTAILCAALAAVQPASVPQARAGELEDLRGGAAAFALPRLVPERPYALPEKPAFPPGALLPPEVSARLPGLGIELGDRDLWRLEEVYNFWRQAGPRVWPGAAGMESVPVRFVFPHKYDVLIGHPRPPAGCLPFSDKLPAERYCYYPDTEFAYGGGGGKINGVFTVSLNTLEAMDAYGAQVFPGQGYRHDYLAAAATAAHEMFHGYQYRERAQLPPVNVGKADYVYTDPEANALLGLEGRILADGLGAQDGGALRELMRDLLAVRSARHSLLTEGSEIVGRYMELVEGTAQYVSYSLQYGLHPGLEPLAETAADPRFAGYSARDAAAEVLRARLASLHRPDAARMASYAYQTGAALAHALDKLDPSWKKDLFRLCSGKSCGLDTIAAYLVGPDSTPARLAGIKARYGHEKILAESEAGLAALLAANKADIDAFLALPGRRVRLHFPGTPPGGVAVGGPADLAEYRLLRLFRRGCHFVEYGEAGRELEIAFSAAAPLLQDRKTGSLELVLPAAAPAAPVITADRVTREGEALVYEGGVSFGNGVFGWKGGRLGVIQREGVTELLFYP